MLNKHDFPSRLSQKNDVNKITDDYYSFLIQKKPLIQCCTTGPLLRVGFIFYIAITNIQKSSKLI